MRVAIHDGDCFQARFPNLALMKIFAWHKSQGDSVEWYLDLAEKYYDRVYSSKVFTFTGVDPSLTKRAILGGTGYGLFDSLPNEIENASPDYSLYPDFKYALGFITRGCVRRCEWCVVPRKEGGIRWTGKHCADIADGRKGIVLLDNNFLAWDGSDFELEEIAFRKFRIDFNQGLDARLVTLANAKLLANVKWIKHTMRFSCDTPAMREHVKHAVGMIRGFGFKGYFTCYVLVGENINDAFETCEFLRGLKVDPFAQAFIDYTGRRTRTKEQKDFCHWVNKKSLFKSVAWRDFDPRRS